MVEAAEAPGAVVVDTYTLLAMAYGELSKTATRILRGIRQGRIRGIIPVTVVYEYLVHWHRGRIPALQTLEEALTFLTTYFKVENLDTQDFAKAAEIKYRGDIMLRNAGDAALRGRRLSIVDSTIIACALKLKSPILTGDRDLTYVASKLGVEVLW